MLFLFMINLATPLEYRTTMEDITLLCRDYCYYMVTIISIVIGKTVAINGAISGS